MVCVNGCFTCMAWDPITPGHKPRLFPRDAATRLAILPCDHPGASGHAAFESAMEKNAPGKLSDNGKLHAARR